MRRGQDATHQARRDRVDVAVGLDVTAGNVPNPFDDRLHASLMALTLDGAGHSAEAYRDRKSTRLNSSHSQISYAVFCLKNTESLMIFRLLELVVCALRRGSGHNL